MCIIKIFNEYSFCFFVIIFSYVVAQEYFEELNRAKYTQQYNEIPKKFELRGVNVKNEFNKYVDQIQHLAKQKNVTVAYRVKVETIKPRTKYNTKKMLYKKDRSKKYNVPLKKKSMKLSNFEVFMRKMADESMRNSQKIDTYETMTTETHKTAFTKQIKMKFKPIIRRFRTNYTKIVKPVRNKIITLTL